MPVPAHPPESEIAPPCGVTPCGNRLRSIGFLCLVLVLGWVIYAPVRHFTYVSVDDPQYIVKNEMLRQGFTVESVKWAFLANASEPSAYAEYWEPLTLLSRIADVTAYGNDPGAFHLTNLALHLLNTVLLCAAIGLLTGVWYRSAFVALVFLVHPMNVEPVCWISARKDVLCATFSIATLIAYAFYARQTSRTRYGVLLLSFLCALMAKPMGVSLPFVMMALDFWPLRRWETARGNRVLKFQLIAEKLPLIIVSLAAAFFAVASQSEGGGLKDASGYPLWARACNAVLAYGAYLRRVFWPVDLAFFYPHPSTDVSVVRAVFAAGFLCAVFAVVYRLRRSSPYLLSGWLWFGLMLGPVIGLVQVGDQAMADRYAYLSTIGIFIMVTWLAVELLREKRRLVLGLGIISLAFLSVVSVRQVFTWKNSVTLFERLTAMQPRMAKAYALLGDSYYMSRDLANASRAYRKCTELMPEAPAAWSNLGNAELELGHRNAALECYTKALDRDPNWTLSLVPLGLVALQEGLYEPAANLFERAIQADPNVIEAYSPLISIYEKRGNLPDVARVCRLYLARFPAAKSVEQSLARAESSVTPKAAE